MVLPFPARRYSFGAEHFHIDHRCEDANHGCDDKDGNNNDFTADELLDLAFPEQEFCDFLSYI